MMALDGKTLIKEEITDKDTYETVTSNTSRRNKVSANSTSSSAAAKDSLSSTNSSNSASAISNINLSRSICRTPDSPVESVRAVAPRSPMSPQMHQSGLAPPPQRPTRNGSASPVVNGANSSPPLPTTAAQQQQATQAAAVAAAAAAAAAAHVETARLLGKIRKFLGSLVQLAQELHPEVSERVRALALSLGSGGISIDEFRLALQEVINLPLRPYVVPLLKNHIPLLQREIVALSRATNQTTLQYVTNNENVVLELMPHGPPPEYSDIFVQLDGAPSAANGTNLVFKRRASETHMELHTNGASDWSDYMSAYPPAKRLLAHNPQLSGTAQQPEVRVPFGAQPTLFEYNASAQAEANFGALMDKSIHRDERELRAAAATETQRLARAAIPNSAAGAPIGAGGSIGGEEEWKNIHTMLNCISAMVDKTKRAITILQQRGVDPQPQGYADVTPSALLEIRRQTEEKVAEFKRNAEEAVNQVKRQAVVEIQRAVVAAEGRAAEVMAQERLRMEKFFVEMSRHSGGERELDNKSPSYAAGQNACWNCGRKATETCSGCNLARYCGAFCQHKDWEHHHQICGSTRSSDLSTKHASQAIPLSASIRGAMTRSPPTSAAPPPPQQQPSAQVAQSQQLPSSAQPSSLVPNGVSSK